MSGTTTRTREVAYFDRFDICEAHALIEADYNEGGMLWERATVPTDSTRPTWRQRA